MFDNSFNKTNPKAPDYVCKDRECIDDNGFRTGVWATDTEKNAAQAVSQPRDPAPGTPQQQKKLLVIDKAMELALKAAKKIAAELFREQGRNPELEMTTLTDELVVNLATTMYISRVRDRVGVFKAEKEALAGAQQKAREAEAAAKEAIRIREEEERARQRALPERQQHAPLDPADPMFSPDDDDLPF